MINLKLGPPSFFISFMQKQVNRKLEALNVKFNSHHKNGMKTQIWKSKKFK